MATDEEEKAWARGARAAWASMLAKCIGELGYEATLYGWESSDVEKQIVQQVTARWLLEREQTIALLRRVCADYGDNDWNEKLHLRDVIEKHLVTYLEDWHDSEQAAPPRTALLKAVRDALAISRTSSTTTTSDSDRLGQIVHLLQAALDEH